MRGRDRQSGRLFSDVSADALAPADHPLRPIERLCDAALDRLSGEFAAMYAATGRPSIPPEKLLRALLLQAFFSVRSERPLMQQITCSMLFRWFVGLDMDAPVRDATVFTKNRDRLLQGDIARGLLVSLLADPEVVPLLSSEHFSVDGTRIEAWAELAKVPPASAGGMQAEGSMKSFRPKDGSGAPPDPGRNGARDLHAEKLGALPAGGRIAVGADKLFDTQDFVAELRRLGVTPQVAQHTTGEARRSTAARRAMPAMR